MNNTWHVTVNRVTQLTNPLKMHYINRNPYSADKAYFFEHGYSNDSLLAIYTYIHDTQTTR